MYIISSSSERYLMSLSVLLGIFMLFGGRPALGCSNVGVSGNGYTATARTMDFPLSSGGIFGLGKVGDKNTTDLTVLHGGQKIKALTWTTEHNFLGQTWLGNSAIFDGVNDEGLYTGYFYLPQFTEYPRYDPADPRPALGIMEVTNYLLATAGSVSDALERLKKVQVIINAMPMYMPGHDGLFVISPLHIVLRDKKGDSAVVEWVKGKQNIYPDSGPVITNSPPFDWQVLYAQQFDYVTTEGTAAKFDGVTMNGTGFGGIPGDWSPPSRFARAYQIARLSPEPDSMNAALRTALSILESMQVPWGTNPSMTVWKTLVDLNNSVYYFQPMFNVIDVEKNKIVSYNPATSWVTADLNKIVLEGALPKGWVRVNVTPTPEGAAKELADLIKYPEGGPDAIKKLD
ncbi:MAG: linear amide C-N hydrolase [Candidatus Brocadiales bacterium]|nr:linear amide C-N hydrolase [Candidatus Bathyanammoxibius sp.]